MFSWLPRKSQCQSNQTSTWRFLLVLIVCAHQIAAFRHHRDLQRGYTALETIVKRGVERLCDSDAERILQSCRRPLVRLSGETCNGDINSKVTQFIAEEIGLPVDEVARRLRDEIKKESDYVQECSITGNGYINVVLRDRFIRKCLRDMSNDTSNRLNVPLMSEDRVVIDYFSPNVGKSLHMGHLRSAAVGGSIANILEFCGSKVLRRSHVGDFGAHAGQIMRYLVEYDHTSLEAFSEQFNDWQRETEMTRMSLGYSLWELKEMHTSGKLRQPTPSLSRQLIVNTIGEIYRQAKEIYGSNPDFARRCKEETALLQRCTSLQQKVWKNIARTSSNSYRDILEQFGLEKLRDIPESCYVKRVVTLINRLVQQGHAVRQPDGSITIRSTDLAENPKGTMLSGTFSKGGRVIQLEDQKRGSPSNQPNDDYKSLNDKQRESQEAPADSHEKNDLVLITKEGAATYLAVDLAALAHRVTENKASRILYVTDLAQKPHFRKVESVARRVGILKNQQLEHLGYGEVKAPSGKKMRSRSGVGAAISSVWEETVEALKKEITKKGDYMGPMADFMAKKLAAGSILFADLSTAQHENYTFSVDRLLNLGGNSLIAILYCYVRCRSIDRKIQEERLPIQQDPKVANSPDGFRNPISRKLAMRLIGLENAIYSAACLRAPHRLCKYIWTLSKEFAQFYETVQVIENGTASAEYFELVSLVSRTIKLVLGLLNIETVERL